MWICAHGHAAINTHGMAEILRDGNDLCYRRMGDMNNTWYAFARYATEKRTQEVFIRLMNALAAGDRVFVMPESDYKEREKIYVNTPSGLFDE